MREKGVCVCVREGGRRVCAYVREEGGEYIICLLEIDVWNLWLIPQASCVIYYDYTLPSSELPVHVWSNTEMKTMTIRYLALFLRHHVIGPLVSCDLSSGVRCSGAAKGLRS